MHGGVAPYSLIERDPMGRIRRVTPMLFFPARAFLQRNEKVKSWNR